MTEATQGDTMYVMAVGTDERAYYERLGAALRGIRRARSRTAEDVAGELGVSVESLTRWERGQHSIKAFHLAALAEAYGLLPAAYHELIDPPEPVNPWASLLDPVEDEAEERFAERADTARRADPNAPGDEGSPAPRAPRVKAE